MPNSTHNFYDSFFKKYDFRNLEQQKFAAEQLLNKLSDKIKFSDLISEYITQIKKSGTNSPQTYFHDNGYYKIVLYHNSISKVKLRLHVWPMLKSEIALNNIHNHRWGYFSKVLIGKLINEVYEIGSLLDKKKYFHYRYFSKGNKSSYHLDFLGEKELYLKESITYKDGSLYFQPNHILHRIVTPFDEMTATLIITHESSTWKTNDLYSSKLLSNSEHCDVEVKPVDFEELEITLNAVYSKL